jgi:hypothetical protein
MFACQKTIVSSNFTSTGEEGRDKAEFTGTDRRIPAEPTGAPPRLGAAGGRPGRPERVWGCGSGGNG